MFSNPITAKYVRLKPLQYYVYMALRWDLIGCAGSYYNFNRHNMTLVRFSLAPQEDGARDDKVILSPLGPSGLFVSHMTSFDCVTLL